MKNPCPEHVGEPQICSPFRDPLEDAFYFEMVILRKHKLGGKTS